MARQIVLNSAIILISSICYINSLGCGFVFDDVSAIKDNKDLRPTTAISQLFWNDFWGTPMNKEKSHKSYRPLCVLTFRWNYALSELEPMSYHLINVVLHASVCAIYMKMCQMFLSQITSFVAALIFAVHPIHTEAVTGVVGRAEMLSSIFYLSALLTYAKSTGKKAHTSWKQLFITIILVTIAMLSKEQGITIIGVCCVYEVFIAQKMTVSEILQLAQTLVHQKKNIPSWFKRATVRLIVLVGSTLLLLFARIKIMGAQLPVFTRFDNPASVAASPARHLTFNYLLPVNAWLLLFPSELCCDWTMGTIPLIESIFDSRNIATFLFYITLMKFALIVCRENTRKSRSIIMALALTILPFIPASNLFFPVGFVVAERILYAPSMGFCMLVAIGFEILLKHKQPLKNLLWTSFVVIIVVYSAKTFRRNYDWESEYSLFKAALRVNQQNAKLFNNVGHALENKKEFDEALKYFTQASKVQPDDIGAHINVGRTYNNLEMYAAAEQSFRTALDLLPPVKPGQSYTARVAPSHLNVFINLGNLISKDESRLLEADALLRTAISMRADFTQAYINRGDILMRLNRTVEAQEQYEIALKYDSNNPDIHYNLGVVLIEIGKTTQAMDEFQKALALDPDHKQTLFNSAVLIQESGSAQLRPTAYKRLQKLLKVEPENEKIYFNLGMLGMDDKDFRSAEKWFRKAIEIKEDFRSALFNLALMLNNDLNRPDDAFPILEQLLQHFPNHSKGLILMGDININHRKDIPAAEKNFLSILEREPNNVQAYHNLCVVYVEQGYLYKAEKCLEVVHQMAPEETYIVQHLNIVRSRIQQYHQEQKRQQATSIPGQEENQSTGHP